MTRSAGQRSFSDTDNKGKILRFFHSVKSSKAPTIRATTCLPWIKRPSLFFQCKKIAGIARNEARSVLDKYANLQF